MKKEIRIENIKKTMETEKGDRYGKEVYWRGAPKNMRVYKIPLDFLVYNKYNGRILSRIQSLERQDRKIDETSAEGRREIERLLWNSKINANEYTLENIKKFGQRESGIITKDGIIIDGNRRAMILGKLNRENPGGPHRYFKAAVLSITLDESPLEIEQLETMYQMGEDKKLSYNPIEKYLKADRLRSQGMPKDEIAVWMGEPPAEVDKYLKTKEIMDDYLEYFGYDGIYTQLDNREDQFLTLKKWLDNFYNKQSPTAFDGYTNMDVDDLKFIAFDYIRAKFEGKKFRIIATGRKRENHFFGNKRIWSKFCKTHNDHMKPIKGAEEEDPIDFDSMNLEAHLGDRDEKYGEKRFLDRNIGTHEEELKSNKASGEPEKLIRIIRPNLETLISGVRQNPETLQPSEVEEIEEMYDIVTEIIQEKTPPEQLLAKIVSLLRKVKIEDEDGLNKGVILDKLDEINRVSSNIKKELGD